MTLGSLHTAWSSWQRHVLKVQHEGARGDQVLLGSPLLTPILKPQPFTCTRERYINQILTQFNLQDCKVAATPMEEKHTLTHIEEPKSGS